MTEERLESMKEAAVREFAKAMLERGSDAQKYELLVHLDELVGPMAFVTERGTKQDWTLPMFQAWLSRN